MTCCREGTICYWNDAFRLQRVFLNAGQLQSEKKQRKSGNETTFQGTPYRWIHDALYCPSLQKVILSSDDHQITFYGLISSFCSIICRGIDNGALTLL